MFFPKKIKAKKFVNKMQHAKAVEKDAEKLLKEEGYKILSSQDRGIYKLKVNGETKEILVIPDFVVKKNGKVFIAEVKRGKEVGSIKNSHTRRQLLEYFMAYAPDGVLLLDMNNFTINTVEFLFIKNYQGRKNRYYLYLLFGILLGGVCTYLMLIKIK